MRSPLPMPSPLPSRCVRRKPPPMVTSTSGCTRIDFAKRAPRDLKMLVFAIPVLLALALHPALPKVRVAAPAAANGIERNVSRALSDAVDERSPDDGRSRRRRAG